MDRSSVGRTLEKVDIASASKDVAEDAVTAAGVAARDDVVLCAVGVGDQRLGRNRGQEAGEEDGGVGKHFD